MKKLCLLTSITMGVLLLFATMAMAQEVSVIDSVEKVIIRAFITGTPPAASAYLEVRNSDGTFATTSTFDQTKIVVTELPSLLLTKGADTSQPQAYRIHNGDLNSYDISISQDETDGTIYVFCTGNAPMGWHAMKFVVQNLALTGACGTSGGGTFPSKPAANLCSIGDPSTVTGTGPWNWTCTVAGQTTPTNCTANIQTYKVTPSAGSGGSISPSTQQTVNSGSTTSFTVTPNTGYTATVGGTCGGSPTTGATPFAYTTNAVTADCTVSATFALTPVNGVCGSSDRGTFGSAPTTNLCGDGSTPTVSGSGPWTWSCLGANGGQPASCSANKTSGTVDLDFTRNWGSISNFSSSCSGVSNYPCAISMGIVNNGTGAAGNFKVKVWFSGTNVVDSSASLVAEWDVAGLAAGATLSHTFNNVLYSGGIHVYYYFIIKIDADNEVVETNESNNTYAWQVFMYR